MLPRPIPIYILDLAAWQEYIAEDRAAPNQLPAIPNPPAAEMDPLEGQMDPLEDQMDPLEGQMDPPAAEMDPPVAEMDPLEGQMDPLEDQIQLQGIINPAPRDQAPAERRRQCEIRISEIDRSMTRITLSALPDIEKHQRLSNLGATKMNYANEWHGIVEEENRNLLNTRIRQDAAFSAQFLQFVEHKRIESENDIRRVAGIQINDLAHEGCQAMMKLYAETIAYTSMCHTGGHVHIKTPLFYNYYMFYVTMHGVNEHINNYMNQVHYAIYEELFQIHPEVVHRGLPTPRDAINYVNNRFMNHSNEGKRIAMDGEFKIILNELFGSLQRFYIRSQMTPRAAMSFLGVFFKVARHMGVDTSAYEETALRSLKSAIPQFDQEYWNMLRETWSSPRPVQVIELT